jgi:uncharacterized protein involved in oxidation of intracellular sulfur
MKTLFIINDPPYGTERTYNALRLAHALLKKDTRTEVVIFLLADVVVGARAGQKTPDGYYNVERMLNRALTSSWKVLLCGTCMDARGLPRSRRSPQHNGRACGGNHGSEQGVVF